MGIEAAIIGGASLLAGGSAYASHKASSAQKKAAQKGYDAQMMALEQAKPMDIKAVRPDQLREMNIQGGDVDQMFLANPLVLEAPELDQLDEMQYNDQYTQDLGLVRERIEERFNEGIPAEQQQLMAQQSQIAGQQAVSQSIRGLQAKRALGYSGGGILTRAMERVQAQNALAQSQNIYNTLMSSYQMKVQAENELLNLGKTEEARLLNQQHLDNIITQINNGIKEQIYQQDINQLNAWNNLMLDQKRIAANQAQGVASATAQYAQAQANAASQKYGAIGNAFGQIGGAIMNMGMQQYATDMKVKAYKEIMGGSGSTSSSSSGYTPNMNNFVKLGGR